MAELPTPGPQYGQLNTALVSSMMTTSPEDDAPFYAVNLMKYREHADYGDGKASGISGREADNKYFPVDVLTKIGAQVVFVADVESQFAGDDVVWDRIAIVRYPTRRSMIEMNMREDFQKQHVHKAAGMDRTIVMLCEGEDCPVGPSMRGLADLQGQSRDEAPRVVMHLARLADSSGANAPASSKLRPEVNLSVAGTIIGDGRDWSHVRMTRFEGEQDLADVRRESAWSEAEEALAGASAERYSMVLKVSLDWWAET